MTRSLLPLLLVLSACSEGITLHLGLGSAPVEGFHVHALLGDGRKVISEANGQGDAFLPTSLDAPGDVSVVRATDGRRQCPGFDVDPVPAERQRAGPLPVGCRRTPGRSGRAAAQGGEPSRKAQRW